MYVNRLTLILIEGNQITYFSFLRFDNETLMTKRVYEVIISREIHGL